MERIEQECRYHAVMDLCRAALSTGGASGSAGALDLKGVTVAGLAGAIDASRMLAATTPHALHVRTMGSRGELRCCPRPAFTPPASLPSSPPLS